MEETKEYKIDIDFKNDDFGLDEGKSFTQPYDNGKLPQIPHNGKKINKIVVSQDTSYVITYSSEDASICGWLGELEKEGNLKYDMYFKLDEPIFINKLVLSKKMEILFYGYFDYHKFKPGK